MTGQLELSATSCKFKGCAQEVVGSSITGTGHVCKRHNAREWGESLKRNRDPYYQRLGALLDAPLGEPAR